MNYTFTIVTVTLNNYKGLLNTYDSITMQSSRDYQWVVIDGNSSDDTCKFLDSLKKGGSQVKWISEDDSGIYNAMNKGVSLSDGDYVIFLNAGDVFADKNVLQNLSNLDNFSNYDIIYGDSYEKLNKRIFYKKARNYKFVWYGMFTHHQSILYRRKMLLSYPYSEDLVIASDYDTTAKLISLKFSCLYTNMAICIFTAGGLSSTSFSIGLKEQMYTRIKVLKLPLFFCYILYLQQNLCWMLRKSFPFIYIFYRKIF